MKKVMLLAAVLLLNMLWPSTASALFCNVNATNLSFGSFNPLTDNTVDSTATITVDCDTVTVNYTIALSPGGGTYSQRRMASGSNTLDYNLYRDAGYSQIWGNNTGGSFTVSGSFLSLFGGFRPHTVYGRIPLSTQRGAMVGSYLDSITATITYL